MTDIYSFAKRVAVAAFIVLLVVSAFYMLGKHGYFFLLVFAGILIGVLFAGVAEWFEKKFGLKHGLALFLSIFLVFGLLIGAIVLVAPTISKQAQQMQTTLPEAIDKVQGWLDNLGFGQQLIDKMPNNLNEAMGGQDSIFSRVSSIFSKTLSALADILIVLITAIFLAANPSLYTVGFSKLFPVRHRSRVTEVLGKCYQTLKLWLMAMLIAMTIIGVSTAIGYSLIGMPLALALALIAFLFAFIPNIGPWIAAIPAAMVGLTVSPQMALYAMLLYGGIQLIESYVVTPLIFQKTVDLPPALLLFFQVLLGILHGALGLLLAAPLLAVLMVLVKELFVKDVIEHRPQQDHTSNT